MHVHRTDDQEQAFPEGRRGYWGQCLPLPVHSLIAARLNRGLQTRGRPELSLSPPQDGLQYSRKATGVGLGMADHQADLRQGLIPGLDVH